MSSEPSRIERSDRYFPIKRRYAFLNSCGVGPVYLPAARAQADHVLKFAEYGSEAGEMHGEALSKLREAGAKLFRTSPDNLSFIPNCALGLNVIALGLPFQPGDEILSYAFEYPSNRHPWLVQEERQGAVLRLVQGDLLNGKPVGFSLDALERQITGRTKLVALSHVQFTSGFAVDLKALGALCRSRGLVLVVDAAQSAGCLPVYPEEWGIDAVVASGWKWLMGPMGSGLLYTTQALRDRLRLVLAGPDGMQQGEDYLDYRVLPWRDGRMFHFSTLPCGEAAGLAHAIDGVANRYGVENIWKLVTEAQNAILGELRDCPKLKPVVHRAENRSGILSFEVEGDPAALSAALKAQKIVTSVRGGYLRIAPHFYYSQEEAREIGRKIAGVAAG